MRSAATPTSPCIRRGRVVAGGLAVLFGLVTMVEGGSTLLAGPEARAAADVVLFVLLFNVLASPAYVAVGILTLRGRRPAVTGAAVLAVSSLVVYAGFWLHAATGGAWSGHTAKAMAVRTLFWGAQWLLIRRRLFAGAETCPAPVP